MVELTTTAFRHCDRSRREVLLNSERRSRFPFPETKTKTSKLVGHVAIREDLTLTFVLDSGIIE